MVALDVVDNLGELVGVRDFGQFASFSLQGAVEPHVVEAPFGQGVHEEALSSDLLEGQDASLSHDWNERKGADCEEQVLSFHLDRST
ncbi:hypothetical protein, partial [Salmonella enterica]|uniref:hypothetical protein n=1 Tax=Salmonella enterica TaxID=28901 RepID=UPI00329A18E4